LYLKSSTPTARRQTPTV